MIMSLSELRGRIDELNENLNKEIAAIKIEPVRDDEYNS